MQRVLVGQLVPKPQPSGVGVVPVPVPVQVEARVQLQVEGSVLHTDLHRQVLGLVHMH